MLLHHKTKAHIDNFVLKPSHAVIIRGPAGSGKLYLAFEVTARLLALESAIKLGNYPYFKHIAPVKKTVAIDQVRELQKFFQLKTTGSANIRRVAIVEDAHLMSVEAQNALLKILEEPPQDSVLILTAQGEQSLKATVYSRAQLVTIHPPELDKVVEYYGRRGATKEMTLKAYLLAGGNIGLTDALIKNDETHELLGNVKLAKQVVSLPLYDRLREVDSISKQPEVMPDFLYALRRVLTASVDHLARVDNDVKLKKAADCLRRVHEAEASLRHNPNTKLLLTDLFIRL